jgi:hypothetical protein
MQFMLTSMKGFKELEALIVENPIASGDQPLLLDVPYCIRTSSMLTRNSELYWWTGLYAVGEF